MSAWPEPPPGCQDMTPFVIRSSWPAGVEVWVRVSRCASEVEARRWIEAESTAPVAWDTLLRGSFRP